MNLLGYFPQNYSSVIKWTIESNEKYDSMNKGHAKAHGREITVLVLGVSTTWGHGFYIGAESVTGVFENNLLILEVSRLGLLG